MAVTSGTKLGPYEVVTPLGAGGMGEVYLGGAGRVTVGGTASQPLSRAQ